MPITKQDIAGFGNTLKDTLTAWGEQIQYGRDVVNLQKIQNKVQNVKSFSTDANGNPLSMEDMGKKLFAIDNEISSTIRNPTLMAYARQNVGDFFKSVFTGAKNTNQNQLEINAIGVANPRIKDKIPEVMNGVQSSWVDVNPNMFGSAKEQRPFSPHYRTQTDPDDPMKEQDIEIMYQQNPQTGEWGPVERVVATRYRTKETPDEKRQTGIDIRSTPTTSRNFNSSPEQFQIATGTDANGKQVQVKVGSYGNIKDMNGNILKGVNVPTIEFKTGTDTIDNTQKTYGEKLKSANEVFKSTYTSTVMSPYTGKPVPEWTLIPDDIRANGSASQYLKGMPPDQVALMLKLYPKSTPTSWPYGK